MKRPNRHIFVCSQPPLSGRPSIDPPATRQRAGSYQTEHRGASRRIETSDCSAQSCRVTDSLPVEDFGIRIDDRFRFHRLTAHVMGIIGNSLRRSERETRRRDAAFHSARWKMTTTLPLRPGHKARTAPITGQSGLVMRKRVRPVPRPRIGRAAKRYPRCQEDPRR